jgi:hypothetical protein
VLLLLPSSRHHTAVCGIKYVLGYIYSVEIYSVEIYSVEIYSIEIYSVEIYSVEIYSVEYTEYILP